MNAPSCFVCRREKVDRIHCRTYGEGEPSRWVHGSCEDGVPDALALERRIIGELHAIALKAGWTPRR